MADINTVAARTFASTLHITAQQKLSKTVPYLEFQVIDNEDFAYDSFGNVRTSRVTSRFQPVVFANTNYGRRQLSKEQIVVAVGLYGEDINNMLADPKSSIIRACIAAMNRDKDRIVVTAALADVKTGKDFGTTVTFANDNGLTVNATAGVTYEKVLEARQNFKRRDVESSSIGFFMSEQEEEALMKETELLSRDFTAARPVDSGMLNRALGMDLVIFGSAPIDDDPILKVVSTTRSNILVSRNAEASGIVFGISRDVNVRFQERTDLIDTDQIVVTMTVGAVRTEGALVQEFTSTVA